MTPPNELRPPAYGEVPRVSSEAVAYELLRACRPAILEPGVAGWAAPRWSPEDLVARAGHRTVFVSSSATESFDYGKSRRGSPALYGTEPTTLGRAAALIRQGGEGRHRYVMQTSVPRKLPELIRDYAIPAWVPRGRDLEELLWFGGAGNVTPLHFDLVNNLFVQVHGAKTWTLFGPSETRRLYPYPPTAAMYHIAEVDPERPDLRRHPAFSEARGYRCTLAPGDVLFVPAFWWHHVRSNDVAISLSFWWSPEVRQCLAPRCGLSSQGWRSTGRGAGPGRRALGSRAIASRDAGGAPGAGRRAAEGPGESVLREEGRGPGAGRARAP